MTPRALRVLVACDFNGETFAAYLRNDETSPLLTAEAWSLNDPELARGERTDALVAWARPESISPAFRAILEGGVADGATLDADADRFADRLATLAGRTGLLLVPTLLPPHAPRVPRGLDGHPGKGAAWALLRLNARLAERLGEMDGAILLDTWRLAVAAGADTWSPKLWYLAKTPYGNTLLQEAACAVKSVIRGATGGGRKALVVDLDNTLWGGIVGDDGYENLRVGGHDHAGEAFADFQRGLRALARRGVILAIASKNEEAVALEALDRHPEMILRRADFTTWRINWRDKAANIADMARELNLSLDAFVFLDDSPLERARVRETLPDVLVPEWPTDPMLYPSALASLHAFERMSVTDEDRSRVTLHAASRRHDEARAESATEEREWVRGLLVKRIVRPLVHADLPRATQLFNKTHQFNLATRRLPEAELAAWSSAEGRETLTVRVSDRFGEYGLTGLISIEQEGEEARIVDFLLSCRIFGRHVEDAMLHCAIRRVAMRGAKRVTANYLPSGRNLPILTFLERSGLTRSPDFPHRFVWSGGEMPPPPGGVTLEEACD